MTPVVVVKIRGKVVGKKNAKKLARRGKKTVLVAKAEWVEYHKLAMDAFRLFRHENHHLRLPMTEGVHVQWYYHPASHVYPDWSAICETVGDLLEVTKWKMDQKTGEMKVSREGGEIILNDKQIRHMDGSRIMDIDKLDPRLIIEVYRYHPFPGELEFIPPKTRKKANE